MFWFSTSVWSTLAFSVSVFLSTPSLPHQANANVDIEAMSKADSLFFLNIILLSKVNKYSGDYDRGLAAFIAVANSFTESVVSNASIVTGNFCNQFGCSSIVPGILTCSTISKASSSGIN